VTQLRIKDVSERSGFTPATLRYYEEIGIVPSPQRSESGYRLYDDRVLERLAFIARAKQLGCSLEEISELTVAWDGGRCGPVQDRLRALVADKINSAQRQIAEFIALTADLHRAARELERHRPDGPCDDTCGCVSPADGDTIVAVSLIAKPSATAEVPIACTLDRAAGERQLAEWQSLLKEPGLNRGVRSRAPINGGVRLEFGNEVDLTELTRLAAAEQGCCQFFSFAITVDHRGIGLEVRAPRDAEDVVAALFGVPA
jgi:DNA-binding transcriptional MerR regulator